MDGLKVAAFYSLPSFALGFCGPQDKRSRKTLSDFASGRTVLKKSVREIFEKFEAAYPYYKLIANNNDISDPLDERVVRAFWLGNDLLEKVNVSDIKNLILTDFCRPGLLTKTKAKEKSTKVPKGALPHHSFHVLVLGAITARVELKGTMFDLCRVGWGKVRKLRIRNSELRVSYKPLVLGGKMRLGDEVEKNIGRNKKMVPKVKVGDWVSFHWGQACEVLDDKSVENLEHYTKNTIKLVNEQSK